MAKNIIDYTDYILRPPVYDPTENMNAILILQ